MMKKLLIILGTFLMIYLVPVHATTSSGNYEYNVHEDGTIGIAKYNGTDKNLIIPNSLDGKTVTSIEEAAFRRKTTIETVVIPDTVKEIDSGAFADATNLRSVTLGKNIEDIYSYAFQNTAITTLFIPEKVDYVSSLVCYNCPNFIAYETHSKNENYKAIDGILYDKNMTILYSYPSGKTTESYQISNTIKVIKENAFIKSKLQHIAIPNSVTTIERYAFYQSNLQEVTIPSSVTKMDTGAFSGCKELTDATIEANIGILELDMFNGDSALNKVILPETLRWIRSDAFADCSSLKSVFIPAGTVEISRTAFPTTTNLDISKTKLVKQANGAYIAGEEIRIKAEEDYEEAYEVLRIVNEERAKYNLEPLVMNTSLLENAMERASELSLYFSHTRPNTQNPESLVSIQYGMFGENIAAYQSNASAVMKSWMNSPGHRSNILNKGYKSIGIGCVVSGGRRYWVQMFTDTVTPTNTVQPANRTFSKNIFVSSAYLNYNFTRGDITIKDTETIRTLLVLKNSDSQSSFIDLSQFQITYSDPSVATIDAEGTITPKRAGITNITVTTKLGKTVSFKLTVTHSTIAFTKNYFEIIDYNDICLQDYIKVTDESKTSIHFESSDPSVARVYNGYIDNVYHVGCLDSRKAGTTTITATLPNGEKATATVAVKFNVRSISLNYSQLYMDQNQRQSLKVTYNPSDAIDQNVTWKSSNSKVASVSQDGSIVGLSPGTATITATSKNGKVATCTVTVSNRKVSSVVYQTQVQQKGWLGNVANGAVSGTSGLGLRMETLKVNLQNQEYSGDIEYRSHVQRIGWESTWKKNGELSGTTGQGLRLEAIQIRLTGEMAKHYDVYYRIHVQRFGWLDWAKNGEMSGTSGFGFRVEAVQIQLVKKGEKAPGNTTRTYVKNSDTKISYQTQVQQKGWLASTSSGGVSGTTGSGLRMESLKMNINSSTLQGGIEYRTHIQRIGWESTWKKDGELSGTTGQGLRLEAVQIRLTGEMANIYDIYYRVHTQNFGWLGWAKNGESAGTAGYGYRVEAIQVIMVQKYQPAPGKTENSYRTK